LKHTTSKQNGIYHVVVMDNIECAIPHTSSHRANHLPDDFSQLIVMKDASSNGHLSPEYFPDQTA
jgi:hypothetical protein